MQFRPSQIIKRNFRKRKYEKTIKNNYLFKLVFEQFRSGLVILGYGCSILTFHVSIRTTQRGFCYDFFDR